jgi:hypothetical protein
MAQALRGLRWRAAWMVAVVLVIILWRVLATPGGGHIILVQFGVVPELEGATVFIDGDSAGTLQKRGSRTLTGFRVTEGEHTITVGMEGCPGELARVTTGFGAGRVMLLADVEDQMSRDGIPACRVVLRP